ncbi:hypothetical protein A2U01_0116904, partial [Trifolium medium]|nr:hypothetical protein [Trifolium medium]
VVCAARRAALFRAFHFWLLRDAQGVWFGQG